MKRTAADMAFRGLLMVAAGTCLPAHAGDAGLPCPLEQSDNYYFPVHSMDVPRAAALDTFVRGWYSGQLRAMGEPSLSCGPLRGDWAFRFTWLRTFHHPAAFRVVFAGDGATLFTVELDGAGGYDPGKPVREEGRNLSAEEATELKDAIQAASFWDAPTLDPNAGRDGAEWIFEGRRRQNYHVVNRWSPETGAFRSLGELLIKLSGLKITKNELY